MKRTSLILILALLLPLAAVAQTVSLAWDYTPGTMTNYFYDQLTGNLTNTTIVEVRPDTFRIRATENPTMPLMAWPVRAEFPAYDINPTNGATIYRTNFTIPNAVGAKFFVMQAVKGVDASPFSNVDQIKPNPKEGQNFIATKK